MEFSDAHIVAYLKGDLPSEALRECDALMHSSPEFKRRADQIRYIYNLTGELDKQKQIDAASAWRVVSRRISRVSFRHKIWDIARTAAAVLLPLLLIHQYIIKPMQDAAPESMITIASAPGVVTKASLPDGSQVWLNAQSTLTYPQRFSKNKRTVRLTGEAYFKVAADKKHRFDVVTPGDMTVSAFGTEFNVAAYPDAPDYQVTLAQGNVDVMPGNAGGNRTLQEGQKAVLTLSSGEMDVRQTDTYVDTAWKDGKMVFRRERLENIALKLSRKFGVVIRLEGEELKGYEYTATFTDETLEDILDLLKRSAPISYTVSKQKQLDNNTFTQREVTIRQSK